MPSQLVRYTFLCFPHGMSLSQTMPQDPEAFDDMYGLWEWREAAAHAAAEALVVTHTTTLSGRGPKLAAAVALLSKGPELSATTALAPAPASAAPTPAALAPGTAAPAPGPGSATPTPAAPAPAAVDDCHGCGLGKWFLDIGGSFVNLISMCIGSKDADED